MRKIFLFIFILNFISVFGQTQSDFTGIWKMEYKPWPHVPAINLELDIYEPVKGMIYPTRMKLSYAHFQGEYDFLLIKKDDNQLGIARNKYPIKEEPFGLGPWMMYLNGHFDLENSELSLKRLWIDNFGIFMTGLYDDELQVNTKSSLRDFLYNAEIQLKQTQKNLGKHPNEKEIIDSKEIYYGIYDPIEVKSPEIKISVLDEDRYDKDSVTIVHNGKIIADKIQVSEAGFLENLKLEKGNNFIAFFAENYGDIPPNTAAFLTYVEGAEEPQYAFDFAARGNTFATAMIAYFWYNPKEEKPKVEPENSVPTVTKDGRKNLAVGRLKSNSEKVFLEVWDEMKEDGDVVSISLNDKVLHQNLEVKRNSKRIEIDLKKGKNILIFRAENLGKIPPNTAALRIYGGGIDKYIQLNTDFKRNNLVEIDFE